MVGNTACILPRPTDVEEETEDLLLLLLLLLLLFFPLLLVLDDNVVRRWGGKGSPVALPFEGNPIWKKIDTLSTMSMPCTFFLVCKAYVFLAALFGRNESLRKIHVEGCLLFFGSWTVTVSTPSVEEEEVAAVLKFDD